MTDQLLPAVLLLGMPGVGKGTQGELLGKIRGLCHLSMGALLRSLPADTEQGRFVQESLGRGQFVPDHIALDVWSRWLDDRLAARDVLPQDDILLLDGIPRTVTQCGQLTRHVRVLQVIHLHCEDEEPLVRRLRQRALIEGRADDADESVVRQRFEIYRHTTAPILNFYNPDIICDVDPIGTPAEVLKRILERLVPLMSEVHGKRASFDGHSHPPDDGE